MAQKDEYINEAYKTLDRISADKMKRLEYEAREKAIRDYNHQMYHARKAGFDEGMKEGIEREIKKLIFDWTKDGYTTAEIAKLLKKTEEEIAKIQKG